MGFNKVHKIFPKITIITPSYNQGHFIEETINSVLSQNYPNLEYMIFDGGSNDNTVKIIKKYEKYFKFWVSERDQGQSDAINKGLLIATGDIFNWLNSDDCYEPNCLNIIAKQFENSSVYAVCGQSNLFKERNINFIESSGTDIYKDNLAKTIGWSRIDQPATFFRKAALDQIGLLETNFHYVMDKEWWIRYLLLFGLNNIRKVDVKLVNFRLHDKSKTTLQLDLFSLETASIFFNISKRIGETELAQLILDNEDLNHNLKIQLTDAFLLQKKKLLTSVLHYFLLCRADYYYSINNRDVAQSYLNFVQPDSLHYTEKALLLKLKLKNKFLPIWIKNIK